MRQTFAGAAEELTNADKHEILITTLPGFIIEAYNPQDDELCFKAGAPYLCRQNEKKFDELIFGLGQTKDEAAAALFDEIISELDKHKPVKINFGGLLGYLRFNFHDPKAGFEITGSPPSPPSRKRERRKKGPK